MLESPTYGNLIKVFAGACAAGRIVIDSEAFPKPRLSRTVKEIAPRLRYGNKKVLVSRVYYRNQEEEGLKVNST